MGVPQWKTPPLPKGGKSQGRGWSIELASTMVFEIRFCL
jgi:hypothetical protein